MLAELHDVSDCIAVAEVGRHDRAPEKRKRDLSAMGVPSDGEINPARHVGEDVGVVGKQDEWGRTRNSAEGPRDVVVSGPEIRDPCEPDRWLRAGERQVAILEDTDSDRSQSGKNSLPTPIEPAVVIPQHGVHSVPSLEFAQHLRRGFGGNELASDYALYYEVAREEDEIGYLGVGLVDDLLEHLEAVVR